MNASFKRKDIKPCDRCGRGVAAAGPTFYTLTIGYHALDPRGIQQTHGLEQFFGGGNTGAWLADAMGANPDLTQPLGEPRDIWICLDCGMKPQLIASMAEGDAT